MIKNKIKFSSYKRKLGAVAKSYMKNCFLTYEEMREYLVTINEEVVSHI
jgi:hypothetical protein